MGGGGGKGKKKGGREGLNVSSSDLDSILPNPTSLEEKWLGGRAS